MGVSRGAERAMASLNLVMLLAGFGLLVLCFAGWGRGAEPVVAEKQ